MKKTFFSVCIMCFIALMMSSCEWYWGGHPYHPYHPGEGGGGSGGSGGSGGDGSEVVDPRIPNVVPDDVRDKMEDYMPIYNGITPPTIAGIYLAEPMQTVYDGFGQWTPGSIEAAPMYMNFYNQNSEKNTLSFKSMEEGELTDQSDNVYISGSDNNFTVYFNSTAQSFGVTLKLAVVISGTASTSGIKNLYYGVVVLSKSENREDMLPDGSFRVFKDGDGNSPVTTWPASVRAMTGNAPLPSLSSILSIVKHD